MQWYYAIGDQQFGPVEEDELRRLIREKKIQPSDLVWNPSLGDAWSPVSGVPSLTVATQVVVARPAAGTGGCTHNRDLMRQARERLSGRWGIAVAVTVIFLLIASAGSIPCVSLIAQLLLTGPLTVGLCIFSLALTRGASVDIGMLFAGFKRFGTAVGAYLLTTLFVLLWMLLLIVPGILAALSYAMTFYIVADGPSVGVMDAIRRSKALMRGHRWKFFCLNCRFIGWWLLCAVTCLIATLWVFPYHQAAMARFYDDLRAAENV